MLGRYRGGPRIGVSAIHRRDLGSRPDPQLQPGPQDATASIRSEPVEGSSLQLTKLKKISPLKLGTDDEVPVTASLPIPREVQTLGCGI